MDKAAKTDTMVRALRQNHRSINSQHRLRCAVHVLNLVIKAILYCKGITGFSKSIIGSSDLETFDLWRKVGANEKVHNTVKHIMRSDKRQQLFIEMQRQT